MKLLYLVLFLFYSLISSACFIADQHRMFPIGIKNNHLIVLETELQRDNRFDEKDNEFVEFEIGWQGALLLRSYTFSGKKMDEFLVSGLNINDLHYEKELQKYLKKGLRFAKRKYGKVSNLKLDYLSFCDFATSGEKIAVYSDTLLDKVFVKDLDTKVNYDISYLNDTTRQARELIESTYIEDKTLDNTAFGYNLHISSVRIFSVDSQKILFIQAGNGQFLRDANDNIFPAGEEYKLNKISKEHFLDLAYTEPILHHGNGFDFFILIK